MTVEQKALLILVGMYLIGVGTGIPIGMIFGARLRKRR